MITLVPLSTALKELHFANGLPGFPAARRFGYARGGSPGSPFLVLTGHDPIGVNFVVVPPESYFPDYRPDFSSEHLAAVGLDRLENGVVLVIVTLGGQPSDATANLLGPLLVHPDTGEAVQAVQREVSWETRAPLVLGGSASSDEG
jgi:flagellar assembly factor FliW